MNEEQKYNEVFEKIYANLKYQLVNDENYGIDGLERLLDSMMVYEGQDWTGRGSLKDASISATIAAIMQLITEYADEADEA